MGDDRSQANSAPKWVNASIVTCIAVASAALVAAVAILVVAPVFADDRIWNAAGVLSLFISAAGVAVALMIYARQYTESNEATAATRRHLSRIETKQDALNRVVALNPKAPAGVDPTAPETIPNAEDAAEADRTGLPVTIGNGPGRLLPAETVPLSVIADLVIGWRAQPALGNRDGAWTTGNLVGAYRPSGQGNHPWYVTFEKPNGEIKVWRLYRGGRSRASPFVQDVTP